MHAYITNSEYARWALLITLEVCLVWVVVRRRVYRRFPAFSIYAVVLCAKSWLLLFLSTQGSLEQYFVAYWSSEALAASILLCVVMEVVNEVCLPGDLTSDSQIRALILVCLTAAAVSAVVTQHDVRPTTLAILNALIGAEKALGYATCSVLACLLVFSGLFGLSWPRPVAAIASGIVICFALSTVADTEAKYFPGFIRFVLVLISASGAMLRTGIWLAVFWKWEMIKEAQPRLSSEVRDGLRAAEALYTAVSLRRSWR